MPVPESPLKQAQQSGTLGGVVSSRPTPAFEALLVEMADISSLAHEAAARLGAHLCRLRGENAEKESEACSPSGGLSYGGIIGESSARLQNTRQALVAALRYLDELNTLA